MAKKGRSTSQIKWLVIPLILIGLVAAFVFFKGNTETKPSESTAYQVYQNSEFGFSINYPESWEIRNDTQAFENGDIVSFNKTGPTQKAQTEITDGARLSIAIPFAINTDLKSWLKDNFSNEAKFSQMTFGGVVFEQVNECYIGCFIYFYTLKDGKVFGMATFAAGDDSYKMVYENALLTMLKSFKFDN